MAFPDETRYYSSLEAADNLLRGDFSEFSAKLASTYGRPGDAVIRLVPALVQKIAYNSFGLNTNNPVSLGIPVLFNFLILVISAWLFYQICRLIIQGEIAALTAALLYACLVNTSLYMRHILPYDAALCLMLYLLYSVLNRKKEGKELSNSYFARIGFLSSLLITIYPGFYAAPFIVLAVLIDWLSPITFLKSRWKAVVVYAISGVSALLMFEIVAQLGHHSYLISSFDLAHTIDQGSYDEGFSFLFKYLLQVEGPVGLILIILLVIYFYKVLIKLVRTRLPTALSDLDRIMFIATGFFLFHAFCTFYVHKMVFYGRLLHLYLPLIVLAAISVLESLVKYKIRDALLIVVSIFATGSFLIFFINYQKVSYPSDVLYHLHLKTGTSAKTKYVNQIGASSGLNYESPQPLLKGQDYAKPSSDTIVLINFAFLFPMRQINAAPDTTKMGETMLFDSPHFINFTAYQFEGYTIPERDLIRARKFRQQIRVFKSATL